MADFMEEEYRRLRGDADFSEVETLRFGHYRQLTLEDPDEIWVDQTETGELHYAYIARFRSGEDQLTYVVVCLAIDGVPSFVFLSFPTRDEALVDEYRRGREVKVGKGATEPQDSHEGPALRGSPGPDSLDSGRFGKAADELLENQQPRRGAEQDSRDSSEEGAPEHGAELSAFERLYLEARQQGDIPRDQFERFEGFVEPTIDEPDEIWRLIDSDGNEWCTFITRHNVAGYSSDDPADALDEFTMIVVCEPTLEDGEDGRFEVVFAFPTIDPGLTQHFRKGINSLNKAFGVGWTRGRAA